MTVAMSCCENKASDVPLPPNISMVQPADAKFTIVSVVTSSPVFFCGNPFPWTIKAAKTAVVNQ